MTQEEYDSIDWQRGNTVRLNNGKEYLVKKHKKRFILLYSEEHDAFFVADHNIIDCRTSDYAEPIHKKEQKTEVAETKPAKTTEPAKAVEPAKAAESAKAIEPAKAAEPAKAIEPAKAAEPAKAVEPAKAIEPAEGPTPEVKPKRKRQRITKKGTSVEKIVF